MKLILRYGPCVGVTLYQIGRLRAELWVIPRGYTIPEHSHPQEDIELFLLSGIGTMLYRKSPEEKRSTYDVRNKMHVDVVTSSMVSIVVEPKHLRRAFSIPAGFSHGFSVTKRKLIFINFSKWKKGVKVTSAAEDFQLTEAK